MSEGLDLPQDCGPYERMLLNLGRIIERPKLLQGFAPSDWIDHDIAHLIEVLKGVSTKEEKLQAWEELLSKWGVVWRLAHPEKSVGEVLSEQMKLDAEYYRAVTYVNEMAKLACTNGPTKKREFIEKLHGAGERLQRESKQ